MSSRRQRSPGLLLVSIGPTTKLPTLGHIDFDTMQASYAEQAEGLYDGGVDLFIIETCQDVLQIKAALNAVESIFQRKGTRRPVMVSVTMENYRHDACGVRYQRSANNFATLPH